MLELTRSRDISTRETDISCDQNSKINLEVGTSSNSSVSIHSGLSCAWEKGLPIIPEVKFWGKVNLFLKRIMDLTLASSALLILSPFLLFIALLIRLNCKGPVFFRQERVGYKNRAFKMLKFRTMYHHKSDISGVAQTKKGDCRISKIGKILRKTSIDELPQLINIIRGEMSFVGPRPHVNGQLVGGLPIRQVVPFYDLRHETIPGLTGWAQANGYRGPTDNRELAIARIEHDMAYIQNASIWLDIKIIFLTMRNEFISGNGH
ncbi:MAG: sugar transferase [Devosiaceae bacterium]|nr:sugar transferase [Devosiaceae bacterium]